MNLNINSYVPMSIEQAIGVKQVLGEDYEVLNRIKDLGWKLDNIESSHESIRQPNGNQIEDVTYTVDGILDPDRDTSMVKIMAQISIGDGKPNSPKHVAYVHVGYLPTDSEYSKHITKKTFVKLRYTVEEDLRSGKHIRIDVLGVSDKASRVL